MHFPGTEIQIINELANNNFSFFDNNLDYMAGGTYGVNQHATSDVFSNLAMSNYLVEKYVKLGFSYEESVTFLKSLDSKGACSYAALCNAIIANYKDSPQQFYNDFGFYAIKRRTC